MNKSSKKAVLLAVLAVMVMGVMAGCGAKKEKTPEIVGTWKACTVEASGVSVDFDAYVEQMGADADNMKMEIEVKEDKTFTMDMVGEKTEGTWKEEDGTYILTAGGDDIKVEITDGKLIFEEKKVNLKVTFEKK